MCIGASPGKQVQLRGQLTTQIKQLHELIESGVISLEEYNSQKAPCILEKLTAYYLSCIFTFVDYHDIPQSSTQHVHMEVKQKYCMPIKVHISTVSIPANQSLLSDFSTSSQNLDLTLRLDK